LFFDIACSFRLPLREGNENIGFGHPYFRILASIHRCIAILTKQFREPTKEPVFAAFDRKSKASNITAMLDDGL
jgi:hypothetical protein